MLVGGCVKDGGWRSNFGWQVSQCWWAGRRTMAACEIKMVGGGIILIGGRIMLVGWEIKMVEGEVILVGGCRIVGRLARE